MYLSVRKQPSHAEGRKWIKTALKSNRYLISREMRDPIKLILIDPKQQPVYLKYPRLKWEPQLQSTRLAIYILPSGFVQMVGTVPTVVEP